MRSHSDEMLFAQVPLLTRLYNRRFVTFYRETVRKINETVVAIYTGAKSLCGNTSESIDQHTLGEEVKPVTMILCL